MYHISHGAYKYSIPFSRLYKDDYSSYSRIPSDPRPMKKAALTFMRTALYHLT